MLNLKKELTSIFNGEKELDSSLLTQLVNATGRPSEAQILFDLIDHFVASAKQAKYVPAPKSAGELEAEAATAQAAAEKALSDASALADRAKAMQEQLAQLKAASSGGMQH